MLLGRRAHIHSCRTPRNPRPPLPSRERSPALQVSSGAARLMTKRLDLRRRHEHRGTGGVLVFRRFRWRRPSQARPLFPSQLGSVTILAFVQPPEGEGYGCLPRITSKKFTPRVADLPSFLAFMGLEAKAFRPRPAVRPAGLLPLTASRRFCPPIFALPRIGNSRRGRDEAEWALFTHSASC